MKNFRVYLDTEKKWIFQSTKGIFSWVIHKVSRYHPTKSFHDCLIEQTGLSHEGKNNPGSAISLQPGCHIVNSSKVSKKQKRQQGCHVQQEGRKGKPFIWRRSLQCFIFSDIHKLWTWHMKFCGVYIPLVTLLHHFASISLLKGS